MKFFKNHWTKIVAVFFFTILFGAYAQIFAISAPYTPSQHILDPACPPGEDYCTVDVSPSQWITTGSDIYYNSGNVGVGLTDPSQKLSVNGNINTYNKFIAGNTPIVVSFSPTIDPIEYFLPPASESIGKVYKIINTKVDNYVPVNIYPVAGELILGDPTNWHTNYYEIASDDKYTTVMIYSDGVNWNILSGEESGYYLFDIWGIGLSAFSSSGVQDEADFQIKNLKNSTVPFSILASNGNVGIGTETPTALLDIKLPTEPFVSYRQFFSEEDGEDSLNDAIYSGSYTGASNNSIHVIIDNEGIPDTFRFYDDNSECAPLNNPIIIPMTGSSQLLCNGISISFNLTTGHSILDRWEYEISVGTHPSSTSPILKISDDLDNNYFSVNAFIPNSIFIGNDAGLDAPGASNSNFFGTNAGSEAIASASSNFFGNNAGNGARDAISSNFFGTNSGREASSSSFSNFFGAGAGQEASNATNSNFFGRLAGQYANNAMSSNFFGYRAGYSASSSSNSNFFGNYTGNEANSSNSNFFGDMAGAFVTSTDHSNFFGYSSGKNVTSSSYSNFFGYRAGDNADNASNSNFFGMYAGNSANFSLYSNFFGYGAGNNASGSANSNFFGSDAGDDADGAEYSNLFGFHVGMSFPFGSPTNKIGTNNIIIGKSISLPNGFSDRINLGGILFGKGAYNLALADPSINAFPGGKIGIGVVDPAYTLDVYNSGTGIMAQFSDSTTGSCTIDPAIVGAVSCSSDINLKKNIINLEDNTPFILNEDIVTDKTSLNKILALNTVTYNFKGEDDSDTKHTGFIAQEVEQLFPDLVSENPKGLAVNYVGLSPYIISAIQELNLKVEELKISNPTVSTMMSDFFGGVVVDITDGVAHLKNIIVDTLKVGSSEKPTGITLYDEVTGDPYCLSIANGETKTTEGECDIFISIPETVESETPTPEQEIILEEEITPVETEEPVEEIITETPVEESIEIPTE